MPNLLELVDGHLHRHERYVIVIWLVQIMDFECRTAGFQVSEDGILSQGILRSMSVEDQY